MSRLYGRAIGGFRGVRTLAGFLDGKADYTAVDGAFAELAAIAVRDYPARLLGSVLAQVLGGAAALVSGTLTVTPASGGAGVMVAGAGGA